MNFALKNIDAILAIILAVTVWMLSQFGVIPNDDIPGFTLILLIALAIFLTTRKLKDERRDTNQNFVLLRMEQKINEIERRIATAARVEVLHSNARFYELLDSLITPESELLATTFSDFVKKNHVAGPEVQNFFKNLDRRLKNCPRFRLKRVAYVPNLEKLYWLKETIEAARGAPGYQLAIIGTGLDWVPLMNLSIVDRRHVVVFGKHQKSVEPSFVYFEDPNVAAIFVELFDEWWRASNTLKEAREVRWELFKEIERNLADGCDSRLASETTNTLDD